MRLIIIAVSSCVLFIPVYALMSGPFGNDWGAGVAMVLSFPVFPAIGLNLWKSKPKEETFRSAGARAARWRQGAENAVVSWAASMMLLVLVWLPVAWLARLVFNIHIGLNSPVAIWIVALGTPACAVYAVISSVRWAMGWSRPTRAAEKAGYWFRSTLFDIEPGEDAETNPRIYGKQLAIWLKSKFEAVGYGVEEVIPEDWGWCVMCTREPYRLWIGCTNLRDYDTAKEGDPPPKKEEVFWHCVPIAEIPFLKRMFTKIDVSPGLDKLDLQLREILSKEADIEFVDEP